ncbi:MAG: HisA/HisF-related TIM barrel protein [Xanthomonadales bacterium]|nr:HisA/HisF-related TIM barrel protein [Xanthomonadales bacterium]
MSMILIPAIDLLDGACVRLLQGDFDERTVYDSSAAALARTYAREGAEWLHVVDLAASRDGEQADIGPLLRLLAAAPQSVQTGGGVRERADVVTRLDHGAARVVVGSVCAEQPERFARWLESFGPERLVAALDVRLDEAGLPWPRTHGWTRGAERHLWDLLDFYTERGLRHLLCTDIGRDGAMSGPNLELYRALAARYPSLAVQASGGVSSLADLRALADTGVDSAISGKALLDGRFTVTAALGVLS